MRYELDVLDYGTIGLTANEELVVLKVTEDYGTSLEFYLDGKEADKLMKAVRLAIEDTREAN